jgi:hypothetical protein
MSEEDINHIVTCYLMITNTESQDRQLFIRSARLIDNSGNDHVWVKYTLGSETTFQYSDEGGVVITLISNAPTSAKLSFLNIPQDTISITVLTFQCGTWSQDNAEITFAVYFRNIIIKR